MRNNYNQNDTNHRKKYKTIYKHYINTQCKQNIQTPYTNTYKKTQTQPHTCQHMNNNTQQIQNHTTTLQQKQSQPYKTSTNNNTRENIHKNIHTLQEQYNNFL